MKPLHLAGTCLFAVLAAGPATVAGVGAAAPAGPGASVVLTAVRIPQARVLNPGPPTGLAATAGSTRVTLSWRPPASDGGAAIIGYDVYMGTSPGGESRSSVSGLIGGTSFTVTGLTNGTTYYFTVDAVNDAELHSAPSAEASATGKVPRPVIVSLAAVAAAAVAAAAALTARRLRRRPRRRPPAAPPADVRAVPEPGPPSPVSLHEIGLAETYVVRLEPLPAAVITTIEELEPTS